MLDFTIVHQGRLAVSPRAAWLALMDPEAPALWHERIEAASGPEGSEGLAVWRVAGRWLPVRMRILESDRSLEASLDGLTRLLGNIRVRVTVDPDEGGTAFRIDLSVRPRAMALPLVPWVRLHAEIELHRAVRSFRAWIEGQARSARRAAPPWLAPASTLLPPVEGGLASVDFVGA